jgi:hypothetical protein
VIESFEELVWLAGCLYPAPVFQSSSPPSADTVLPSQPAQPASPASKQQRGSETNSSKLSITDPPLKKKLYEEKKQSSTICDS